MSVQVTARNGAPDSENRIHSDEVARQYGFPAALVPGITVYGYIVSPDFLERGTLHVRFLKPVIDGDQLLIRTDSHTVTAERQGEMCAVATLGGEPLVFPEIAERLLPDERPHASAESISPGTILGTVKQPLAPSGASDNIPASLLELANRILMQNYRLGPWMHVSSDVATFSRAQWGDHMEARGMIRDRFEKKGREFVIVDVEVGSGDRLIQRIRHTAIYRM